MVPKQISAKLDIGKTIIFSRLTLKVGKWIGKIRDLKQQLNHWNKRRNNNGEKCVALDAPDPHLTGWDSTPCGGTRM